MRYNGLIANVGARIEYWAPGSYVDNAVEDALDENKTSTIPDFYCTGLSRYSTGDFWTSLPNFDSY